jgi:predicted lipoprotein with Yx(FWY)xxD motif
MAAFQKEETPIPIGVTMPSPVMTTRDAIDLSDSKGLTYQNFDQIGRGVSLGKYRVLSWPPFMNCTRHKQNGVGVYEMPMDKPLWDEATP